MNVQPIKPRWTVIAAALGVVVCWVMVFGCGALLSSKPYRDQLSSAFQWGALFKALITYTPTNVAVLSVLAGFLGGCASLLLYADYKTSTTNAPDPAKPLIDEDRLAYLTENPTSSAVRGFAAYLVFLSGTVLGANAAFDNPTQDQYIRMAGAVAVLAFTVGFDPTIFRHFISAFPGTRGK